MVDRHRHRHHAGPGQHRHRGHLPERQGERERACGEDSAPEEGQGHGAEHGERARPEGARRLGQSGIEGVPQRANRPHHERVHDQGVGEDDRPSPAQRGEGRPPEREQKSEPEDDRRHGERRHEERLQNTRPHPAEHGAHAEAEDEGEACCPEADEEARPHCPEGGGLDERVPRRGGDHAVPVEGGGRAAGGGVEKRVGDHGPDRAEEHDRRWHEVEEPQGATWLLPGEEGHGGGFSHSTLAGGERPPSPQVEVGQDEGQAEGDRGQRRRAREVHQHAAGVEVHPDLDRGVARPAQGEGDRKRQRAQDEHEGEGGEDGGEEQGQSDGDERAQRPRAEGPRRLDQGGIGAFPGRVHEPRDYRCVVERVGEHDRPQGIEDLDRGLPEAEQAHQQSVEVPRAAEEEDEPQGDGDRGEDERDDRERPQEPAPREPVPGEEPPQREPQAKSEQGGQGGLFEGEQDQPPDVRVGEGGEDPLPGPPPLDLEPEAKHVPQGPEERDRKEHKGQEGETPSRPVPEAHGSPRTCCQRTIHSSRRSAA